jgi:hypothetical protein
MTTQTRTTSDDSGTEPVACSLTLAGLAEQGGRWERLVARALTGRAETEHGLRLFFRPDPDVEEELRQLAAVESQCCRWAKWTVDTRAGHVVLDAHSTGEGIATLHDMFTGPDPAAPVPCC